MPAQTLSPSDLVEQPGTPETPVAAPASHGDPDLEAITGVWRNCDEETRGILGMRLAVTPTGLTVRTQGNCTPTPCEWGEVPARAYATTVTATEAIAFTAHYDHGFAERIVTGLLDEGTLIVETYVTFKDGTDRSPYHSRDYLCHRRG